MRRQIEQELEHLSDSYTKLQSARQKFVDCRASVEQTIKPEMDGECELRLCCVYPVGKDILVPLTYSLYIPGTLDTRDGKVLVDIGTGYYVEKVRWQTSITRLHALVGRRCDSILQRQGGVHRREYQQTRRYYQHQGGWWPEYVWEGWKSY